MPILRYFNGNNGFHRVDRFRDFDITSPSHAGGVLDLKAAGIDDQTRDAFPTNLSSPMR